MKLTLLFLLTFLVLSLAGQDHVVSEVLGHSQLLKVQNEYDVHFYEINLHVNVTSNSIDGYVEIQGETTQNAVSQIVLNFYDHMAVDSIVEANQLLTFQHSNDLLTVDLSQPHNAGDNFGFRVFYHGLPMQSGLSGYGLIFTSFNGQQLIYSYNWPYYASTWLPCKDHPSDKADSVRLLITVPDNYLAASNGVLAATNVVTGNQKQFVWETRYPISPYHVSINIYPFDSINSSYNSAVSGNIPLAFYLFPNHTAGAQPQLETVSPKILEAYESNYGPFPFAEEKYGICESVISGGMEHQTILTMNYPSFFSTVVVHESAHEYFGNMISISDWGHIWLSEGFATYSEAIYEEYWNGPAAYLQKIRQDMAGSGEGTIYVSDPSTPGNIIPYSLVYLKASVVVHMLRYIMGDEEFFRMLHDYVITSPFRYANIDTEQFRAFCETYYGGDLSWFFDQWIYGDGKMSGEYYLDWNSTGDTLLFKIRSVPSTSSSTTYHSMPVPVRFTTMGGQLNDTLWVDSSATARSYYFADSSNFNIQIDPDSRILIRAFDRVTRPKITEALLRQNALYVEWQPFFDFTEYELRVYRESSPGMFEQIATQPVTGFNASFTPGQPGTYGFAVMAIQNGHTTGLSGIVSVHYTTFPMDQGILVIDETRNGNGSNMLAPTDAAVDAFYDSLLMGYPHQQLDVLSENRAPTVLDFAPYSLIVWHHDVLNSSFISESEQELESYLLAGGKVLFSGMRYLNQVDSDFRSQYLGIQSVLLNSSADFAGATGSGNLPVLPVDSSKITLPFYNSRLPNAMVFDTTTTSQALYRFQSASGDPLFHQKPCGVLSGGTSQPAAISLGFPLYFIERDSARVFMEQALQTLGITVGIGPATGAGGPANPLLLEAYPNPFNPSTTLRFDLNRSGKVTILIYDILGQKVRELFSGRLQAGRHEMKWDGLSGEGVPVGSGIFFVQLHMENGQKAIKLILQR